MGGRLVLTCLLLGIATCALPGCTTSPNSGVRALDRFGPGQITPPMANGMVLAFADDHVVRIIEATDLLRAENPNLEYRARLSAISRKNAYATFGIAGSPNPIVAMIDMAVMVSLQQEALRRSAIDRTLTRPQRILPESYEIDDEQLEPLLTREDRVLMRAFRQSGRETLVMLEQLLTPEQIEELGAATAAWWRENPSRRFVSHVRLQDFSGYRRASVETVSSGPRNLLGLLQLDPFAGMDPTTRELAEMRMLADRFAYFMQRFPVLVSMQATALLHEALSTEEIVAFRETIEGTEASVERLVTSIERLPKDIGAEREAAIDQFADRTEDLLESAITKIEAAAARQREELLTAIDEQSGSVNETLTRLDTALTSANELSGSVRETVHSIDGVIGSVDDMDVADFQQIVESAAGGVGDVERSLVTLERLLAPQDADAEPSRLAGGVTAASANTQALVDHLFKRGIQLAAIVLVGWIIAAIVLKLILARLAPRP